MPRTIGDSRLGGVLTLYHDYTSPASAVAVARVDRLAAEEGLPIDVVGFEALAVDIALPVTADVRAAVADVAPQGRAEGVVLEPPAYLPPTALAHVVEDVAVAAGCARQWRACAYRALWERGVDLSDRDRLLGLAADAGLEAPAVTAALDDRLALAAVRHRAGELRREGVGDVPTILAHRTLVPGLLPADDLRALALAG